MSYLYKKGDRWCIQFRFQGRRFNRSLGIRCKSGKKEVHRDIAQRKQLEIDLDLRQRKFPGYFSNHKMESMMLYDFIEEFMKTIRSQKARYQPTTLSHYHYSFRHLKKILPVDMPLEQIDRRLVQKEIIPYLYRNYAHNTVRGTLIDLRAAFNTALDWEYLSENPFAKVKTKRKKTLPKFCSPDEIEIMRRYFAAPSLPSWQGDIVFLILNTGLRREEVAGSRNKSGLDWDRHVFLDIEAIKLPGKGDRERVIPLVDEAKEILRNRPRRPKLSKVFHEIRTYEALESAFYRMKQRTGLTGDIHQLRKTFASSWAMQGKSPYQLMEILGHESLETVMIYYSLSPEWIQQGKKDFKGFKR